MCQKQQFSATTTSTWRNERGTTTRENGCNRETMVKIRAVIVFAMVQAALAREHASRRPIDVVNAVDQMQRHKGCPTVSSVFLSSPGTFAGSS